MFFLPELILAIMMLNSTSYKERASADKYIRGHEVCFECLLPIYEAIKLREVPEVKLTLKEILWFKYYSENWQDFVVSDPIYDDEGNWVTTQEIVNSDLMRHKFKAILKYGL